MGRILLAGIGRANLPPCGQAMATEVLVENYYWDSWDHWLPELARRICSGAPKICAKWVQRFVNMSLFSHACVHEQTGPLLAWNFEFNLGRDLCVSLNIFWAPQLSLLLKRTGLPWGACSVHSFIRLLARNPWLRVILNDFFDSKTGILQSKAVCTAYTAKRKL